MSHCTLCVVGITVDEWTEDVTDDVYCILM